MGRTISPTFTEDIKNGVLAELLDIIKKDDELIICFRKDYANVYYKSHSVFKIEEQETKYKFTFNLGHARYIDSFEKITKELSFLCIDAKKYKSKDKNGEVKYTYTAVFSVKKEKNNNIDFSTVINVYKKYIDNFFQGGPRKDLFENENRNTNSLREKRHQQVLFSEHLDVTGELLFYDMELSLPKPKEKSNEMKAIVKEIGKHVTGAPDCLAVRLKNGVVTKIVLVEVKSTREACTGDHGIKKHDEDFNKIIECSYYREFIAESMKETLKLYGENGICENIDIPDALGEKKDDFEILYFFTHDDVKNWVDNSGYDTTGNKSKYEELYNSNPDMFRFVNDDMKHLMGKEYN